MEPETTDHAGLRIELERVTRRFGELCAVDGLDLKLVPGRIHAIIGENGAGKSTVLKMIAGHLDPSAGRVLIDGEPLGPASPARAMARGIGMVHQHFMLVEIFSALENVVLGCEPCSFGGVLDLASAAERARRTAREAGLELDLDRLTAELSVGARQRLEILRVLFRGARAILLDEPTAVLSPVEVGDLYRTLGRLADGGATVAVVTHRLDEVVRFADEVTVMRRGRRVHAEALDDRTRAEGGALAERLTRAVMGGSPPEPATPPALAPDAEPVLVLEGLRARRPGGGLALDGLSLSLAAGEVVGLAGVEGNGQRELLRVLGGLLALEAGSVTVAGVRLLAAGAHGTTARRVAAARRAGLVVVHEDRHQDEVMLEASVGDNLVLGDLGRIDEAGAVARRMDRFAIQPREPSRPLRELSGGNQQKLVLGRALDRRIVGLVLGQPTRGVDVGTARTIHHAVARAAAAGAAVLLISADLNELRSLSHRIVVLRKGRLVAELDPSSSDEVIGRAMLGTEAA